MDKPMKLKKLMEDEQKLLEKKQAIETSSNTNITLHYDSEFKQVGEQGTPEFSFTMSMSSTGGKEYYRAIKDRVDNEKLAELVKLKLRKALRSFDAKVGEILAEYKLQAR